MVDKIKTTEGLPDVPASKVKEAQMQGMQEAIAESAKTEFKATDGAEVAEGVGSQRFTGTFNVFHIQDMVDLDPKELAKRIGDDAENALTEAQIVGLLEVERSGKNRTDVVQVFLDRLGIDSPYEVTDAGPNYTNDVNRSVVKARGA